MLVRFARRLVKAKRSGASCHMLAAHPGGHCKSVTVVELSPDGQQGSSKNRNRLIERQALYEMRPS